jgi:PAS domain S-box-containing protein
MKDDDRREPFEEKSEPPRQKVRDPEEQERRHVRTVHLLRESEELYRAVVENVADAIAITVGGNRVFVNRAFLEIHGVKDVSEVVGLPLEQCILPEDREAVVKRVRDRERGLDVQALSEYRIRRADGEGRWVQASAVAISYKGQPAVLAVLRDITRLKKAEEEIHALNKELERHVQELRSTNEELEAFNYIVSHDLQTPLIAIEGFSNRILKECPYEPAPKCRSSLEIIRTSAGKMSLLTKDLLAYCRTGKAELHRSRVDMKSLVESVVYEPRPIEGERVLDVRLHDLPQAWGTSY